MSKRSKEAKQKFGTSSNFLEPIEPKTPGQKELLEAINNYEIVICDGPAGSGKSFLSFGMALRHYLIEKTVSKIIIVRPTIASGDDSDLGFLPGDLNEKMMPYVSPLIKDSASLLLKPNKYRNVYSERGTDPLGSLLSKVEMEIVPLAFLRGRTFANCFIILDEAQNCTMNDFKLFLTRIGRNSKTVIEGDSTQCDIDDSGLIHLQKRMLGLDEVRLVKLEKTDIVRNPLIARLLDRL